MNTNMSYEIVRAECGTASHWTVTADGEQVACRRTKREAFEYVADAMRRNAEQSVESVDVPLDRLVPGDVLDQGVYSHTEPGVNDRVVDVVLVGGSRYSETRGATVRVWGR